jgi:predicted amidohydrolase
MEGAIRAAVVQINTGADVDANVSTAFRLVGEAVVRGAELVVLPEKFHYLGDMEGVADAAEPLDGPLLEACGRLARGHGIHLVAGSIWERAEGDARPYNTTVLFGPDGSQLAHYRKIHMFDVDVGGHSYRESEECRAGTEVVAVSLGERGPIVGLTVCYDLRFPELYRALAVAGAEVVTVPAAFTMTTGRDHWEVLLRARAIENQMYVVAADQYGREGRGLESYGRSMIVDPWGVVLARVPDGEGVAVADIDLDTVARVRRMLPSLANRVPSAYGDQRVIRPGH